MLGFLALCLISLITGLSIYAYDLFDQYITNASNIAHYASMSALNGSADPTGLAKSVMEIYRGMSGEERLETGTPKYRSNFVELQKTRDYGVLINTLGEILKFSNVYDVYLAMYDQETQALVYIADPGTDYPMYPGEWETVPAKEISKFLNWDGTGMLYDVSRMEKYGLICTAGVPVRDQNDEVCAFFLVDVTMTNIRRLVIEYALKISLALLAITLIVAWFLTRHMKRSVVTPINDIADAAVAYVKDKQAGKEETNHFGRLEINTRDELENLGHIMGDMEQDLTEYEKNISKITAEKERINTELQMATIIQRSMLPNVFPPFPNRNEFDIFASMTSAREVGGDFYDFFMVDEDHLALVMADVSGKGVPAALFMMVSKVILQSCALQNQSPSEILTKTNEALCANNHVEMFVTVWIGILEISTGKVTAGNAGHEYPALYRNGSFALLKDRHDFVVGGMEGIAYSEYEFELQPGDKIFLYTDGVTEASNTQQELFGTDRLLKTLNQDPEEKPGEILSRVQNAVIEFTGKAEQFDDITMMCVEYKG